jgi:hypothetical protein
MQTLSGHDHPFRSAAPSLGETSDKACYRSLSGSIIRLRLGMKRFRWVWFAIAALSIVETPHAILTAIVLGRSDHRLIPIIPLGFAIRFAFTWWFFKLWWSYRNESKTGA